MADPTTQSNYLQITTEHLALEWTLDFDAKLISGSATHHLLVKEDDVKEVIFDTSELDLSDAKIDGKSVPFDLKAKHEVMGSALHIGLPSGLKSGQYIDVKVEYKTTKACTALQWLDKAQTQGKTFSFLFSQCQPIYARAIAPLQDTPSAKIKYSAKVTSVLPVLLSAIRESPPSNGPAHDGKVIGKDLVTYSYTQPVPIPSYLIAIAAGNVVYKGFPQYEDKQWTSGIWAEPELIDSAYWEFSEDTARFVAAEEKIVTPYKFGVYDLLVLPPAFPYGGMENACLTFLTPTLLAGDRSLVDVVVHEATHSWFGNGVTHANASHFWLNEGWTTYIERVLQETLYTPAHRDFSFIIGSKALKNALEEFQKEPKYQRLVIDFEHGEDPDNAFSSIPYEKGANLILHIERTLGGLDVLLPYVKEYVSTFIGKNVTTQEWKDHLYGYFEKHGGPEKIKALDSVDWDAWFYGEGLKLPVEMEYDVTLAKQAYALAAQWDAARSTSDVSQLMFKESDLADFNSNQIIVFLERLQSYSQLPLPHVQHLGNLYKVSTTTNAEIRFRFYELALTDTKSESAKAFAPDAVNWIVGADGSGMIVGRMKFCRPIFRTVAKVDRDLAVKVWQANQEAFHPVARRLIDKDLGLA
ncbi:peptidase family M1-domain-containing protein [Lyophyllum atratum]|nr:peptidase family M1-domain-containing protein [Lyophyllum atratum]